MADPIAPVKTPVKDPIASPLASGGQPSQADDPRPKWFTDAVEADRLGRKSKAVDVLFEHLDCLLRNGDFPEIDDLLRLAPVEGTSLTFLISLLSITLPASAQLPARQPLFDRVWEACIAQGRNAEKLLGGLRRWSAMDGTSPRGL